MSGQKTISNVTPMIGAIKIQQSTYGLVLPIVWGRTRISGNLIWYGDFKAVPHTEVTQSGGKGGGAPQQSTTSFTYSASVAMALCEGPILGIRTAWRGKKIYGGTAYSGTVQLAILNTRYAGAPVDLGSPAGWTDVSVERVLAAAVQDDYRYYRADESQPLVRGVDYTAVAGVYTFAPGAVSIGEMIRIRHTFTSTGSGTSCLGQLGMDLFRGAPGQAPWSYLTTSHPDQALGYSSIAYLAAPNYSLDDGASVENHAFEVESAFMFSDTIPDANPAPIVVDALSNPQYGARFGAEKLASMADYTAACTAQGIFLSPALTEQTSAAQFLSGMAALTNVGLVWSGGVLKFIPYADTPLTGNGVTFTPNTAPIYDLTDDDFQPGDDEGPVKVVRGAVADSFNSVKLEFLDRANAYNIAVMEQGDQADIQENGLRPMPNITAHWIADAAVAKIVATLVLQRSMFVRNTYEFKLGWTKIALEPMDLVTLTDPGLGMNKLPVRILSIEEDAGGYLSVIAEDFPKGSASATRYPSASGSGFAHDHNESPGVLPAPVIFEAPAPLASSTGGLEVWLATGNPLPQYGGCEVWVSLTGANYERAAVLKGASRFGSITSALVASSSETTTVDTVGVSLTAGGIMNTGTLADMVALTTLCYVGGEFIGYENATLTGAAAYTIGNHMLRGAYLSQAPAHAPGAAFVRCDEAVARMPLSPDYIGKTLHIKVLPFNRYGGGLGDLASAPEYTYTVTGIQANNPPIAPTGLAVEGAFTISTAKFKWNRVPNAAIYNAQVWAGAPLALVREVKVGDALRFDYSASDAKVDGGPWRALTFKVQGMHANGAVGPFATLAVANPQVGALTGISARSGTLAVQFSCDRPLDPDFYGIRIWMSTVPGFTPGSDNLVFDGPNTSLTINQLRSGGGGGGVTALAYRDTHIGAALVFGDTSITVGGATSSADPGPLVNGTTYYLRAAGYDTFDQAGLSISPEVAVTLTVAINGVQTANVFLYQYSTATPDVPAGTSTFTWATATNSAYTGSDGWALAVGSNPGTPGLKLYVATVAVTAPIGTTTSTVTYNAAHVAAWSANGTNGTSGLQSGSARVYQWAASIPSGPVGAATYTWATGGFGTGPAGGWTLTPGAGSPGYTLWAATVALTDSSANATTNFSWVSASVVAIGYAGAAGSSYVAAYCASSTPAATSAPAPTTGSNSVPASNSGGITGTWSQAVPALQVGEFRYVSDGIYNPATNVITWSIPYWASLKVGSLSAITANLGSINAGDINIGNGRFVVDSAGNLTVKSTTAGTGARLELRSDLISIYDSSNALRVKIGNLA